MKISNEELMQVIYYGRSESAATRLEAEISARRTEREAEIKRYIGNVELIAAAIFSGGLIAVMLISIYLLMGVRLMPIVGM